MTPPPEASCPWPCRRRCSSARPPPGAGSAAPHRTIHDAAHATTLPGTLGPRRGRRRHRRRVGQPRPTTASARPGSCTVRPTNATRSTARGLPLRRDRALRQRLRQRLLGRHADGLRRRRRHLLQPLHRAASTSSATSSPTASPQYTAGLDLPASPAPSTSRCPTCFGSMVKQQLLGQDADGGRLAHRRRAVHGEVTGVALRSMKAPGTAYDDPVLGKDPQPADMDGYVTCPRRPARQRRRAHQLRHPQPGVLPGRHRARRQRLGGRGPDLVRRRSPAPGSPRTSTSRASRRDRRGRGGPVRRRQQRGRGGPEAWVTVKVLRREPLQTATPCPVRSRGAAAAWGRAASPWRP